jgi:hypothetical protein
MSSRRPLWRHSFDRAERLVGRRLEGLVSTRTFNDVLVLAFRSQNAAYRLFERQTGAVLHLWNMPTRSDVSKLRRQVGALSADLRELGSKLEEGQRHRHVRPEPDRTGSDGENRSGARTKEPGGHDA